MNTCPICLGESDRRAVIVSCHGVCNCKDRPCPECMADEIRSTQIDETFEFSGKRERACISCRLPYATYRTETYVDGEWRKRVRPNLGPRNDVLSPGLRAPSRGRRVRRAFNIDEVLEGAQADSGDEEGAQADSGDEVVFVGVVPPRVLRRTGERPFVELFPPTTGNGVVIVL